MRTEKPLTPKEQSVADLIGCGHSVPEAAAKLGNAAQTVTEHVRRIADKLDNPSGLGPVRAIRQWWREHRAA